MKNLIRSIRQFSTFKPNIGIPPKYVLTTIRSFPSLEPNRFQPVSTSILGLPLRRDILWQAVVFERDGERVGSKHIKNRAEMGYSRKKLRPQKGSGRARMGDRGSPSRHDGGRAFGRQPGFDWSTQLPSQVYALAMRTALSYQYSKGNLLVVDEAEFVSGHSKAASIFIKGHGLEGKSMTIIVDEFRNNIHTATHSNKSTTNKIEVVSKEAVNVRDLLKPQRVIIEENALRYLAMIYAPRKQIRSSRPRAVPEIEEKFNRPLVIAQ